MKSSRSARFTAATVFAASMFFTAATASGAVPFNDNVVSARVLVGPAGSVSGTTVSATSEVGEDFYRYASPSVWFKWKASTAGWVSFDTCAIPEDWDTVLTIFNIDTPGDWGTDVVRARDDDLCTGPMDRGSIVAYNVLAGATYYIQLAGYAAVSTGPYTLRWRMGQTYDEVWAAGDRLCDSSLLPRNGSRTCPPARGRR